MQSFPTPTGENRMLNLSRRSIVSAAEEAQKLHTSEIKYNQPFASTGGVNPNAVEIQSGIVTNFDYNSATPDQRAEQERLMGLADSTKSSVVDQRHTVGSPNIDPRSGAMGQPKTLEQRLKEAGDSAYSQPGYSEDKLRAKQQAEANVLAQYNSELQAQKQATSDAQRRAAESGAGNSTTQFANQNLTRRLGLLTGDRGAYVSKRRAEGASDNQIRQELASLQPQSTTVPPPSPTNDAGSTQNNGTSTASQSGSGTKGGTSGGTQAPPPAQTGQSGTNTNTDTNVPPPVDPKVSITSKMYRNLASAAIDPIEKILMSSYADMIDASPDGGDLVSFSDFINSPEATSVAKGYNDANSILSEYQKTVKSSTDSRQKFAQDQYDRNDSYLAQAQANAQAQLTFANDKAARDLAESNRKKMNAMSNALALQGGFGSAGGNMEVLDAIQKGEQAIVDLNKEYGFKHTDVSLQFTQMHNEAQDKFTSSWLEAQDNFDARIADIATQKNANDTSKRSALKSAWTEKNKAITDANLAHAKAINDATKGVVDYQNKLRDDERAQEQMGIKMLDKLVDTYGNNVPPSLLESVKKYIPNIDVQDVMNRKTLAQLKKGAGGSGSIGGGVPSPMDATASVLYSDVTPQQLSEAVKRVFAPNNYGGSAAERMKKEGEYMSRISKGESPASIMQSLQTDYWASSKGLPRTAHDERITAQGSAEMIGSLVDYYGSDIEDSLGFIDSKVQGFSSIFGLSSEQYNNLASQVGNIRARIVKDNYGAAVTPQELKLAQSYIPSLSDKAGVFTTKLANFKAYSVYLDAKVTASNLGLPMPKPPAPITMSGDKISGASKYSIDDINSTISE